MDDTFVNIKIRKEFRDMLKDYSKHHGYKMYALIETLIEEIVLNKLNLNSF